MRVICCIRFATYFYRNPPTSKPINLYCGICHSDLHFVKNEWGVTTYPVTPGHELVGIVTEVGSKVEKFKIGDKVGVGCLVGSCRSCENCAIQAKTKNR